MVARIRCGYCSYNRISVVAHIYYEELVLFVGRSKVDVNHSAPHMWEFHHAEYCELTVLRSRLSPFSATNSHMTGAPKLETVAVHCGKKGVKCRRFWRRLIGFIKSPLADRRYLRLYRKKFEAILRHISNFLPWTF